MSVQAFRSNWMRDGLSWYSSTACNGKRGMNCKLVLITLAGSRWCLAGWVISAVKLQVDKWNKWEMIEKLELGPVINSKFRNLEVVGVVESEAMVHSLGQHNENSLCDVNANPVPVEVSDILVACSSPRLNEWTIPQSHSNDWLTSLHRVQAVRLILTFLEHQI